MKTYWYMVLTFKMGVRLSGPIDPDRGNAVQFINPPTGVIAKDGTNADHVYITWDDEQALDNVCMFDDLANRLINVLSFY